MLLLCTILSTLVSVIAAAEGATDETPRARAPGSYDLLICKDTCGFDSPKNVLVRGKLVLEAEPYDRNEVPERARKNFRSDFSFIGVTNGCFVLEIIEPGHTYAGLIPVGFTRWSLFSGTLGFELYSSADASYSGRASLAEGGFQGTGVSSGPGEFETKWPPDLILGRRSGPADRSICIRAADEEQDK